MAFNALRNIFSKTPTDSPSPDRVTLTGPRVARHSSGWSALLKHLRSEEGLRVLDIGPTSSSNVNLLTGMGHSIYMADLVFEAQRVEWTKPDDGNDASSGEEADSFFERHMDFSGRAFDVVLLWTTLNYLPEPLLVPMIARLHASLQPKGKILAFFHTKTDNPDSVFHRYHVTETDAVDTQEAGRFPVRQVFTNRKIENLFSAYDTCKFFLAKDNVYEVIVTR